SAAWASISTAITVGSVRDVCDVRVCVSLQSKDLLQWYITHAKDQMMADPPVWFKSFIFCEALLQLPFFPVAAYAFLKGGCRWIRTPAIIYSTHVASTMVPILTYIMFHQFPKGSHPGPQTTEERLGLLAVYGPYLLVPLMILFTMLFSPAYNSNTHGAKVTPSGKKHR
ncbi:hypothetical protein Z043_111807, partial [Scleropages formosus]